MAEEKWYPAWNGRTQQLWGHKSTLKRLVYELENSLSAARSVLKFIEAEHEAAYRVERQEHLAKLGEKEAVDADRT